MKWYESDSVYLAILIIGICLVIWSIMGSIALVAFVDYITSL